MTKTTNAAEIRPRVSEADLEAALVAFVSGLSPDAKGAVTAQSPLLGSGLLDSLGILELTTFLSDTYGVEIADEDFTPETFASIQSLARLAHWKLSQVR
ncbi:MAG: phosphopantetheine-binding protein [Hyphomicrobium sp.]|nr:phosphopantetheine-binding protein [Hyphomicrobium sp.]